MDQVSLHLIMDIKLASAKSLMQFYRLKLIMIKLAMILTSFTDGIYSQVNGVCFMTVLNHNMHPCPHDIV